MSEPVSALKNGRYDAGIAVISEVAPMGMITIRGDLDAPYLRKVTKKLTGVERPERGQCRFAGDAGAAWMSPDELLLFCPHAQVPEVLARLHAAFEDTHTTAIDVSGARAAFRVEGPHAREVLAKLAPVDLAPDQFTPGMFRRTRMGQVPAAFWLRDDGAFEAICFRSVARYMFDQLCVAAQPGSAVGHLQTA
ncbi:sarcosine oxidase subunit gamma [Sulfitobacter sp. 1A13191]|jgi:sarcosine oxidase subunit gamma|uniref:sarcosine oxidase subunit gamma n=1 Tax=unclassified Sulfitobacter TaxID=196795 RepID=UPI0037455077